MKRKISHLVLTVVLLVVPICIYAQDNDTTPYIWEAGGLTLVYPAVWDEPLPGEEAGSLTLQLAQSLVDVPDVRPPGIPIITVMLLTVKSAQDVDLSALLTEALQNIALEPEAETTPVDTSLAGGSALEITGISGDELLYGVGRAAMLSDTQILIITGRAINEQRDNFQLIFDEVAGSVNTPGSEISAEETESYGVAWHTFRDVGAGDDAFLNLIGLALADGANKILYTYERDLGVVKIDALTGEVLSVTPNADIIAPADIAVDRSDTVYAADTICACVFMLDSEGEWQDTRLEGFSEGAPFSITAAPDGRLYATNEEANGRISVLVFDNGSLERTILLGEDLFLQPVLSVDLSGRVVALTQYGQILQLDGETPTEIYALGPMPPSLSDVAINQDEHFVISTPDQGLLILNAAGEEVDRPGRIVPSYPLAGEMASPGGVVVDADGTLYFVDSDGTFGAITAMRIGIAPGRVGETNLKLGLAVQGTLDDRTAQQTWTYDGTAGQRVTISAIDASGEDQINVAVRLIAPDGSEEVYNNDQEGEGSDLFSAFDAQIEDHSLAADGTYIIVVERIDGAGIYTLGVDETRSFTLNADGVIQLQGGLDEIFTTQRWEFEGQAGQRFTMTMRAVHGTLDPLLRLIAPDGVIIEENDDTNDTALGNSAQISGATLPENGRYLIEASRFEGAGTYELIIVTTS